MKKSIISLFAIIILFSCKKDKEDSIPVAAFTAENGGIYISNEGNFQSGNATLTYFNPSNKTTIEDPFKQVNNQSGKMEYPWKVRGDLLYADAMQHSLLAAEASIGNKDFAIISTLG